MATVKFSSKLEESVWKELQALAKESHQSISGLLTEAVRDYLERRRIRPDTLRHLSESMDRNDELGRRLAE
jgi:predicted transcriptional regulator